MTELHALRRELRRAEFLLLLATLFAGGVSMVAAKAGYPRLTAGKVIVYDKSGRVRITVQSTGLENSIVFFDRHKKPVVTLAGLPETGGAIRLVDGNSRSKAELRIDAPKDGARIEFFGFDGKRAKSYSGTKVLGPEK